MQFKSKSHTRKCLGGASFSAFPSLLRISTGWLLALEFSSRCGNQSLLIIKYFILSCCNQLLLLLHLYPLFTNLICFIEGAIPCVSTSWLFLLHAVSWSLLSECCQLVATSIPPHKEFNYPVPLVDCHSSNDSFSAIGHCCCSCWLWSFAIAISCCC